MATSEKFTREYEIPIGWTVKQFGSVLDLYMQNNDGSHRFSDFIGRWKFHPGNFIGATWCEMFVGIEQDGYTHT